MNISMNPNGELYQSAVNAPGTIEIPESFLNEARQFRELNMRYTCAIREVKTKLEVLNDDLAIRNQRNPIQMIKSRVKKPESIIEKLHRRGFPISVKSVRENLYDVAGIRVICSFVDDIYTVAEMLARQDDINVLMVKDYIRCPKVNGYRSYHMIIEVPVFFSDRKENMRVEVQIRTIAMDFWASLDHQMKYKKDVEDASEISEELKECAEVIAQTDLKMLSLRRKIEDRRVRKICSSSIRIRCKERFGDCGSVKSTAVPIRYNLIEIAAQGFGDTEPCFFVQGESRGVAAGYLEKDRAWGSIVSSGTCASHV